MKLETWTAPQNLDNQLRKKFTKEFKISVLRELENGKIAAQLCRENDIHPSMLTKWKKEYKENPKTAFSGNGNISKPEAKLAETERLIGQLYAENAFLKKVLTRLEMKRKENQIQKEGT